MKRCQWAEGDTLLREYHDTEWGVPLHDDRKQFEFLSLEVMQCGLSWLTVLRKREVMRSLFAGFDPQKVASFGEEEIRRMMETEGMIHSPRKIKAIIADAAAFLRVQKEFGTFSSYLWSFTDGKVMEYPGHADGSVNAARNELSDRISDDLRRRGFSFLGSVTIYAHLQAAGVINDHRDYCFRYNRTEGV
jgi:DNA-3-methyladenine glycosylase I